MGLWEAFKTTVRRWSARSVTRGTQTEEAERRTRGSQTETPRAAGLREAPLRYVDDVATIMASRALERPAWTYEDYAEAAEPTASVLMMQSPATSIPQGASASSARAWLGPAGPVRAPAPRPPPVPHEVEAGLPLSVTSGGGCFHRVGCSQLVHCTQVSTYEQCARCIGETTIEWVTEQSHLWFWASRYHTSSCPLRHSGGVRYTPCKHCMPKLRDRRGARGS